MALWEMAEGMGGTHITGCGRGCWGVVVRWATADAALEPQRAHHTAALTGPTPCGHPPTRPFKHLTPAPPRPRPAESARGRRGEQPGAAQVCQAVQRRAHAGQPGAVSGVWWRADAVRACACACVWCGERVLAGWRLGRVQVGAVGEHCMGRWRTMRVCGMLAGSSSAGRGTRAQGQSTV